MVGRKTASCVHYHFHVFPLTAVWITAARHIQDQDEKRRGKECERKTKTNEFQKTLFGCVAVGVVAVGDKLTSFEINLTLWQQKGWVSSWFPCVRPIKKTHRCQTNSVFLFCRWWTNYAAFDRCVAVWVTDDGLTPHSHIWHLALRYTFPFVLCRRRIRAGQLPP